MRAFRFRFHRVLGFRRSRLDLEQQKLEVLLAEARALAAELERVLAEMRLDVSQAVTGRELAHFARYREYLANRVIELRKRQQDCAGKIVAQRAAVQSAQRDVDILEKLKETALREWQYAANRELEALAGESYLARWSARQTPGR